MPASEAWKMVCVRCVQMEFWQELTHSKPSLSVLDSLGLEYERSVMGAEESFVTMLQLSAKSVASLRSYAQFLLEVWTCLDGSFS